ncbi:MAG TPA: lysylphosphatidylglycerol synthase domain-containing protein [Acidimicrobiales bacterium]|nr:lysylphosphatidylglycerol synthase domain-containing protein [Acidimicrobiales bacterium]
MPADGGGAPTGRARWAGVATAAVTLLAIVFLAGEVADIPSAFAAVHGEDWLWVLPAVALAAAGFGAGALALSGAVDVRLPPLRTSLLEVGRSFTTMATPGGVGSFALTVRFLQRRGVDVAPASASAALTSVAALLVDLAALAVGSVLSAAALHGQELHGKAGTDGWLLLVGVVAVAALVAAVWHFPRLRRRVVPQLRKAAAMVRAVARRPRQAARLFLGQALLLATEAGCLYCALALVHQHTTPALLLALVVLATMAQRAVPIPGALGAPEAILVTTLTGVGLSGPAVVAAALTYRLLTYWLPAVPGFVAIRWLRRRGAL